MIWKAKKSHKPKPILPKQLRHILCSLSYGGQLPLSSNLVTLPSSENKILPAKPTQTRVFADLL